MTAVIFGGAGFVGINLAEHLLARGHDVTLFDRREPQAAARAAFARLPGRLSIITGDVTDKGAVSAAIPAGADAVFLGAAVTAGPERDASDPAGVLQVNLVAQVGMIEAAREAGVRRVVNLSSAAAYGLAGGRVGLLEEDTPVDPTALYPITKWASERIGARIAALWGLSFVSARLSGVFGPWEHLTGVRDTPSPHFQVIRALRAGRPALLPREGLRDWVYARDVAAALAMLAEAPALPRPVYNVTGGRPWSVLAFGQGVAAHLGGVCRLAETGEEANIDLFGPHDRAPMSGRAIADDLGWTPRFGMKDAVADLAGWLAAEETPQEHSA
jgi:UDP-glucose 4-epimerase